MLLESDDQCSQMSSSATEGVIGERRKAVRTLIHTRLTYMFRFKFCDARCSYLSSFIVANVV